MKIGRAFFAVCVLSCGTKSATTNAPEGGASTPASATSGGASASSSGGSSAGSNGGASASSSGGSSAGASSSGAGDSGGAGSSSGSSGGIAPACDSKGGCADSSATCCANSCVKVGQNPNYCGDCSTKCSSTQFCTTITCSPMQFASLCANPGPLTLVTDGHATDDEAGRGLAAAVSAACHVAAATTAPQTSAIEDPTDGRPLIGSGHTIILAGGPFFQKALAYLENTSASAPVVFSSTSTTYSLVRRSTGVTIATSDTTLITSQHDFFVVELLTEPISGTLAVAAYGFQPPGTAAASWYASHVMLTDLTTAMLTWAVVEWTDADGDALPGTGDTFSKIAFE